MEKNEFEDITFECGDYLEPCGLESVSSILDQFSHRKYGLMGANTTSFGLQKKLSRSVKVGIYSLLLQFTVERPTISRTSTYGNIQ